MLAVRDGSGGGVQEVHRLPNRAWEPCEDLSGKASHTKAAGLTPQKAYLTEAQATEQER